MSLHAETIRYCCGVDLASAVVVVHGVVAIGVGIDVDPHARRHHHHLSFEFVFSLS